MTNWRPPPQRQRAFTLVELLIAIAVVGVLLTLAAPSFRDFILLQRLKGVNAQLVTDLQFARSEAAARGQWARVSFRSNASNTCYSIFTAVNNSTRCNCLNGVGSACSGTMSEVRTVQVPTSSGVRIDVIVDASGEYAFAYDHISGGIVSIPRDTDSEPVEAFRIRVAIDADRALRTEVGRAGRVTVCALAGTSVGAPAC